MLWSAAILKLKGLPMTDGQSKWLQAAEAACEEPRPIPDERDQMEVPHRPDLRCREHGALCEVAHSLHNRVVSLEERVRILEGHG